jgi:hypothetical protein
MKRRDFIIGAASLSGAFAVGRVHAETKPCPPGQIGVSGGPTLDQGCSSAFAGGVPEPGQRQNVSLNLLAQVDPDPDRLRTYAGTVGIHALFTTWNSAIYAPDYSDDGALVVLGGGHFTYYGNSPAIFDLTTRMWSVPRQPTELPKSTSWKDYDSYYSETTSGGNTPTRYWSSNPGICSLENKDYLFGDSRFGPEIGHMYDGMCYLPPSLGGGAKGSLVQIMHDGSRLHRYDLATHTWSRFGPLLEGSTRLPSVYLDSRRKLLHVDRATAQTPRVIALDLGRMEWVSTSVPKRPLASYLRTHYWAAKDSIISMNVASLNDPYYPPNGQGYLQVCTLSKSSPSWAIVAVNFDGSPTTRTPGVDWPSSAGAGFDYCEADQCFYVYDGTGENYIWKLTPPAGDVQTGVWTISKETLAGPAPAWSGQSIPNGGNPFGRWRYVPSFKSFVWADGAKQPVQLWRPTSAV